MIDKVWITINLALFVIAAILKASSEPRTDDPAGVSCGFISIALVGSWIAYAIRLIWFV